MCVCVCEPVSFSLCQRKPNTIAPGISEVLLPCAINKHEHNAVVALTRGNKEREEEEEEEEEEGICAPRLAVGPINSEGTYTHTQTHMYAHL